jgi:hypothetical protein
MFFLLRTAFWLAIVIALIPVNPADLRDGQRPVSTLETVSIARTVIADLAGFCDRNPQACNSGRELLAQFGAKAKTGWSFVSNLFGDGTETEMTRRTEFDRQRTGSVTR